MLLIKKNIYQETFSLLTKSDSKLKKEFFLSFHSKANYQHDFKSMKEKIKETSKLWECMPIVFWNGNYEQGSAKRSTTKRLSLKI